MTTITAESAWARWSTKYTIHPETLTTTQRILDLGLKPFQTLTLEEARAQSVIALRDDEPADPFDGDITEIIIPSPQVETGIPVTVYKPCRLPADPVICVYFHGGGLVMLTRKSYDRCARSVSSRSGAIFVVVEYRLLPCEEDPLAPFNDALAVTKWVLENKEVVGGCKNSQVGVGGDSAGGQITCSVLNDVQGVAFQVLVYPVTDLTCDLPSFEEFRDVPGFNTHGMEAMLDIFLPGIKGAASNPRVNPSARANLESSPPALVIHAELDALKDWGVAYARKLRQAGVKVTEFTVSGVPHAFFGRVADFPTTSALAHDEVARFIKSFQS
ncbi:ethyl acetate hydrolase-like [Physella acuta]|uniref:ethyl acetate hydrolase-like n=1 Tax=Physella acuta TaxID=109671 RepID=UPI0027DC5EBC|nr:ethyl acetate hydrolase-like [Physella acuta]